MGVIYFCLELLYRQYSSFWMILVGGLCCFLIGRLNEHPKFYKCKMWQQCFIGTGITLCIEFISGMILNVCLKMNIWNYSDLPFNLYGQISLYYAWLWFALMPLCIYVDDVLRWLLFKEQKPTSLWSYYWELVTLK
jgi:uncharacterized membrane protein